MWQTILSMINEGDLCALPLLILVLAYIGNAMTGGDRRLVAIGTHTAAGALVVYFAYACLTFRPTAAEDFFSITFRSVLAAGLILGPTWALAAVFSFVARQVAGLRARLNRAKDNRRRCHDELRQQEQRERQAERRHLEEERMAPERERMRELAEQKKREEQENVEKVQESRLQCEAHYRRHFAAVKDALDEDRFKELIDTYLPKDSDPAVAEARLQIVIDMIDAVSGGGSAVTEFCSLQDLVSHFEIRRRELAALGLATDELDTLENYIELARDRAVERFLSR